VAERGWVAPHWPKEYGGAGMSVMEQVIVIEELVEVGALTVGSSNRIQTIGAILQLFGTDDQKRFHLPRIADCTTTWCHGCSEPTTGSDPRSVAVRAVIDGDQFVLSGHKTWSAHAHEADSMLILALTDTTRPRDHGVSLIIADLHAHGISIRPVLGMDGMHELDEVFFDDVRVPRSGLVGELNQGWYISTVLLDFESSGMARAPELRKAAREVADAGHRVGRLLSDAHRAAVVGHLIESEIARLFSYRIASLQSRGQLPNYEASVSKLFSSEVAQRIANLRVGAMGLYGQLWTASAGGAANEYLRSVAATVTVGTSEVQRDIIATRGLGLPRG